MANRKAPATQTTRLRSSGRRYPGVQGKVVDYISHSIDDGRRNEENRRQSERK
jgi:hypothetical protein